MTWKGVCRAFVGVAVSVADGGISVALHFLQPAAPIFAARCAYFSQPSALQIGAAESARLLAKFVLILGGQWVHARYAGVQVSR